MNARKKMGVMLTVLGAIAYIGYRITTLSSFDSTLNIVLFAIESMCILAVAVEAVLLGVKLPVGKVENSQAQIMQAASKLLTSNAQVNAMIQENGSSDTKQKIEQKIKIEKYFEEVDAVVFVEDTTLNELRRNFLSLNNIEGLRNIFVVDEQQATSTKELCAEFNFNYISKFGDAEIDTSVYLVSRGTDILYPDILNVAKNYDFKGKSWLELRSVFSDEHAFGVNDTVAIKEKRQLVREALSSRSLAPWSTGPALFSSDNMESFEKITTAKDFFAKCENNSLHGQMTNEIASEKVSLDQTYSEIYLRSIEMSYFTKMFKSKYAKKGERLLGMLIKTFALLNVTSIIRRISLMAVIGFALLNPSTLSYMTMSFLAISAVALSVIFAGSYLAGDTRNAVCRIREYYFDVEAICWSGYKKLFKKMSQAKIVNLTKRMPFVSMILIAIDLAIVYRVFMESGAEAGSFVTGIPRNVSMIAGYSLIVTLLVGLSLVVVTQLRSAIRRDISSDATIDGDQVSMVDLSPGGAGVISSIELEIGSHVNFKSNLTPENNKSFECSAIVRSCFSKSGVYRIGLEFEELMQDQCDELEVYCLITYPHSLARNINNIKKKDVIVSKVYGKAQRRTLAYACSFVALGSVFYANISHWF